MPVGANLIFTRLLIIMKINHINQNLNKKPSPFTARIHYVDIEVFKDLLKKENKPFEVGSVHNSDWVINEGAFKKTVAFTRGAFNCVVGSIFNPETKLMNMFHLSPYQKTMRDIENTKAIIIAQARELKGDSKANLEGFLLGGDSQISVSRWDLELVRNIKDTFSKIADEIGMDYTTISERLAMYTSVSVISDAEKNSHFVYVDAPKRELRNLRDLDLNFKTKIISPKDEVIINSKLFE